MRTLRSLALAAVCLLIAGTASAQVVDRYTIPATLTLSGSSRTVTIVANGKRIELEQVSAQPFGTSSSGVRVAIERDCSSVTTTSPLSRPAVNGESAPVSGSLFRVYDSSAASGCTPLSPAWVIPDLALLPIPSTGTFSYGSSGRNINIKITPYSGGSLSGTLLLQITLRESR